MALLAKQMQKEGCTKVKFSEVRCPLISKIVAGQASRKEDFLFFVYAKQRNGVVFVHLCSGIVNIFFT